MLGIGKKKKEEKIQRTLRDEKEPKSRANRVRMLLKKNNGIFKDKQLLTDFKEPILMLIRRSGAVEFYEDASKGTFRFTHSDGKEREIYLEPSYQKSFDYGKRKFKGYICSEDSPLPLPENPLVTVDTVNMIVEKSMMDTRKLDERKELLKIKTLKLLLWALGIGLVGYALYSAGIIDKIIGLVVPSSQVTSGGGTTQAVSNNNSLQITGQAIMPLIKGVFK